MSRPLVIEFILILQQWTIEHNYNLYQNLLQLLPSLDLTPIDFYEVDDLIQKLDQVTLTHNIIEFRLAGIFNLTSSFIINEGERIMFIRRRKGAPLTLGDIFYFYYYSDRERLKIYNQVEFTLYTKEELIVEFRFASF